VVLAEAGGYIQEVAVKFYCYFAGHVPLVPRERELACTGLCLMIVLLLLLLWLISPEEEQEVLMDAGRQERIFRDHRECGK